jgi:chitodextrinase
MDVMAMFKRRLVGATAGLLLAASSAFAQTPFTENWTSSTSPYFIFQPNGGSAITSGVADAGATDGKIVQLTLPAFPSAGPGGGPTLQSPTTYGFGTYEARLKTVDCSAQPNSGVVSGFFTYLNDGTDQDGNGVKDNSEIDVEILCAEPNAMWLTQWTDFQDSPLAMKRIYRELDLATGTIRQTCYSEGYGTCTQDLTGSATEGSPSTITPIPGFNSSTAYYTYGFTWLTNRLTWYIINPANNQKIVLWDYQGPKTRITQRPAYYLLNAWYTNNWSPTTMGGAVEQPSSPRYLDIDSAKFMTGSGTPTPTSCTGCTPTATSPPTPTPTPAPSCYPAWVSNVTYPTGARVTTNGNNYQANYPTNGDNPALHSGPAGSGQPWLSLGPCTGNPTSTPTSTVSPTATVAATSRPRATATATTARPTATPTTPRPTPTTSGTTCAPAWISNITYATGARVSVNHVNYQANYPTNGDNPAVHSGPAGSGQAWLTLGSCS